jgi:predicted ribosome quality control (RQC) complex YloA/Tae2 family protein
MHTDFNGGDSVVLVRKRTIPTERLLHVGEVSANFCG